MKTNKNLQNNRGTRDIKVVNYLDYQQEVRDWMRDIPFINPFAITLTMYTNEWRDYSQNFRHFMNRLNQSFLKSSNTRYGNKLTVIPIREGSKQTHTHYHCVIDNPYPDRNDEFVDLIKRSWGKTLLGLSKSKYAIDIQPMYSTGWIEYITKCSSKSDIRDSVDWDNMTLPPPGRFFKPSSDIPSQMFIRDI